MPYIYTHIQFQLQMNIRLKKEEKIKILCADDLYDIMQSVLMRESKIDRNREHFWAVSLDIAKRLLNIELVSMGTVSATLVEPMEVLSIPLQKRAVNIILVHNHPGGELKPSAADKDTTDRLIQAGRIMHIPVLDHLIISETSFYSFLESGLLKELEQSLKYVPPYEIKRRYEKAALEKGQQKGEKKGQQEKAKAMAKVMKQNGEPIDKIMTYTGLSKGVISRLKVE
jgi:DNA repair protein RadC